MALRPGGEIGSSSGGARDQQHKSDRESLHTGGFLGWWIAGNVLLIAILSSAILWVVGYLIGDPLPGVNIKGERWQGVLLPAILIPLAAVLSERLISQLSTRFTATGVSQWRWLSRRSIEWAHVAGVNTKKAGFTLEAGSRSILIIPAFYRDFGVVVELIRDHVSSTASTHVLKDMSD